MIEYALLWMFAGASFLVIVVALFYELTRARDRTIDDVGDYIRPQNAHSEAERDLFDPVVERKFRLLDAPVNFRRRQRMRFDLAGERLKDKRYAIWVIVQWANTEWNDMRYLHSEEDFTGEALACMRIIRAEGKKYLRLTRFSLVKSEMAKLLLRLDKLRLLPVPSVAGLRFVQGLDLFDLYNKLKEAAVCLAKTYGDDIGEELRAVL